MAAYEDFEFFRTARSRAARMAPASTVRAEAEARAAATRGRSSAAPTPKDALRSELERLHLEVRRLRAHARRRSSWRIQLGRFVSRLLPRAPLRESA
ncbi:MAG: hypothetical protein JNL90_14460 [Planctomycetes bacterium]|nr:hypothetical protein [Planctomycetota bacterium]